MIEFDNVTVYYSNVLALDGVSFRVEEPSFVTVIGPNGSGKTTLLKTALGLIKPVEGRVIVLGKDVLENAREVRREVGYVPQRERIDPFIPLKVKDVVMMGRVVRRGPLRSLTKEDVRIAREALEMVGMDEYWNEPFGHLSGGQQQRVLIARALASKPKLLLMDEPFSGVDTATQDRIIDVIHSLVHERGVGIILVTHDINPVIDSTDYVLLLNKRVIAFGRISEVLRPEALEETYGRRVEVIRVGGACYVIGGDSHA